MSNPSELSEETGFIGVRWANEWQPPVQSASSSVHPRPAKMPHKCRNNTILDALDRPDSSTRVTLTSSIRPCQITTLDASCACGRALIRGPISGRAWCPSCSKYAPRNS